VSRCSSWMMKGSLSIPARSAKSPSDRSFRGPIRRVLARQREDQQLRARLPRLEPARRSQAGQGDVRAPPFVRRDRGVSPQQIALHGSWLRRRLSSRFPAPSGPSPSVTLLPPEIWSSPPMRLLVATPRGTTPTEVRYLGPRPRAVWWRVSEFPVCPQSPLQSAKKCR
jgi:hypothetical protein